MQMRRNRFKPYNRTQKVPARDLRSNADVFGHVCDVGVETAHLVVRGSHEDLGAVDARVVCGRVMRLVPRHVAFKCGVHRGARVRAEIHPVLDIPILSLVAALVRSAVSPRESRWIDRELHLYVECRQDVDAAFRCGVGLEAADESGAPVDAHAADCFIARLVPPPKSGMRVRESRPPISGDYVKSVVNAGCYGVRCQVGVSRAISPNTTLVAAEGTVAEEPRSRG